MSTTKAVVCDGCGATAASAGRLYPVGWKRLTVTGRRPNDDHSKHVGTVDACSNACAPAALETLDG